MHSPVEGFKVFTEKNNKKQEVGFTNAEGEIVIEELRDKYITIIAEDPENLHREGTVYLINPERIDQTETMYLRLNRVHEESYFSLTDEQYEVDSSAIIDQSKDGKSLVFDQDSIDFTPAHPVGALEFYKFIHANKEYPHECYKQNIQGKVHVSFIVQKDGVITNVTVEKGVHKSLDAEAVRLVRYAPKWNPALLEGEPVKAIVKVPVSFTLN